jgi:rubrerythrin
MEEAAEILSRDTTIYELAILIRTGLAHNKSPKEIAEVIHQDGWQKQSEGEWLKTGITSWHTCSVCNYTEWDSIPLTNYCPHCGAKMKGNIKYE